MIFACDLKKPDNYPRAPKHVVCVSLTSQRLLPSPSQNGTRCHLPDETIMTAMKIATQPHRDEMTITAGTTAPETTMMNMLRITTADMIVGGGLHLILVIAASPMQVFRARDVETAMPKIATTARVLPGGWSAVVLTQWSGIPLPVSR